MRAGESFAEALLFKGTPSYPVSATALKASLVASLNGRITGAFSSSTRISAWTSSPP